MKSLFYFLKQTWLLILWFLVSISLTIYSFTQVDLALTLLKSPIWLKIQESLQYIGYYNRPLSTQIYIFILLCLYFLYFLTLYRVRKHKINTKRLKLIIITTIVTLVISYNGFSYDIFNYIFDAKILTYYHQNPYTHKALDFPKDPMLGYMRYIERTYPYGPGWITATVPLSEIGANHFLFTFYLFKAMVAGFFAGSLIFIYKIARKTKIIDPLFAVAFFALNPLVMIECLVSSHNDIVMMFFVMLALYLIVLERYPTSFISFIISVSVKFATFFALPMYLYPFFKKNQELYFNFLAIIMIIAVVLASLRTNFNPWYLMYVLPFIAFRSTKYYFFIPVSITTFSSLLIYAVYTYNGNVNPPVAKLMGQVQNTGFLIAAIITVLAFAAIRLNLRKTK